MICQCGRVRRDTTDDRQLGSFGPCARAVHTARGLDTRPLDTQAPAARDDGGAAPVN